jgi:hypothetical protein
LRRSAFGLKAPDPTDTVPPERTNRATCSEIRVPIFAITTNKTMKQTHQADLKYQGIRKSTMKNDNRSRYVTRESVLMLLSDDEVSAVATAETATRLPDGDEYLDMEQLDQGVQRAHQKKTPMGRVLPKKAVQKDTWEKILKQLPAHSGVKANVA